MDRLIWRMSDTGNICDADNQDSIWLGFLKYERVGSYMHWCWYQFKDISMSPGCLEEVRSKQKELFKERKRK